MGTMTNKHLGSSFDDFLKEEGIYDEVRERSRKKLLMIRALAEKKKLRLTKKTMVKRLDKSRPEQKD